ncbi:FAD binding domain of DNA photolyase-domain-containing protein [Xylariaceae sp. FL0804]|nr:FAD binding domain of DNA photolyase-domain-containing protein [Xylariaceae sp. FL0804]
MADKKEDKTQAQAAKQQQQKQKKHARSQSTDDVLRHPSTKRAKEVDGPDRPLDELVERLASSSSSSSTKKKKGGKDGGKEKEKEKVGNVLHWFRSKDLRADDNRALHAASQKAKDGGDGAHLIACFLYSPADLQWHGTSPARVDFMLESLRLLREQLRERRIPLAVLTADERGAKGDALVDFVERHGVSHVFANFEYEVDELRRDLDLLGRLRERGVALDLRHDQTVVTPGELTTGGGGPHKVFSPYHRAWLAAVREDPDGLLGTVPPPEPNDESVEADETLRGLFDDHDDDENAIPSPPRGKRFGSEEERARIRKLWPAGHAAGVDRLGHFLAKKVGSYAERRSEPAADSSSRLSPYFAAGVISVREALVAAREHNNGSADFSTSGSDAGISAWVRELVFREFYRHMMVVTPHNSMNLPQNLKFDFVQWEDDEEGWKKWCEGRTGVPFVDAGMRQLNTEAYMHNRLRMNTSSYLRTNLLLDYRRGERYFAERLVDWDLCNNTQGWEPSYTVFNPVSQAEKNDPHGDYIRRWVPELADVKGKAVFDPFHRLDRAAFDRLGYPQPHVDWKESKERCIQRYKQDMADADP